ncbi:MAG: alpha/beta hydrolase [Alphaproteobacteria bacterium]|nr:alpha/beta hydrolase [Alphaproteobacteria bacterium]
MSSPYTDIQTSTFVLRTYQKLECAASEVVVYIEGDGRSFDRRGRPTDDPTPRGDFVRRLAFDDPRPNVVYLARPCQYVNDDVCVVEDWTVARFSKRAVDASAEAIARAAGGRPVVLIGFSGGAQIAGLVAVLHPELNVQKIVTIAGNLDHAEWTRAKNLAPLDGSLDLNDYKDEFMRIPQTHYVGDKDTVIATWITVNFLGGMEDVIVVPGAAHNKGFTSF